MKKITLIILSFVLFYNVLQSQNFVPIGTKWRFNFFALGNGRGTIEYEALNDTVISGTTCQRISSKKRCPGSGFPNCPYPEPDRNLYFSLRSDGLFQFEPNGNSTFIFYFKANVGDTVSAPFFLRFGPELPVITRKSDTIIGGQTIKFWELSQKCLGSFPIPAFKTRVYEKIFRMEDGLQIIGRCDRFYEFDATLCSFESGNWVYKNPDCYPNAVNNLDNTPSVTILPNPSSDKLTINSPTVFSKYVIYNMMGQLIQNTALLTNNEVNISNLQNGFYILQLIDNKGFSVNKKFIKQ